MRPLLAATLVSLLPPAAAVGQEFRVHTTVSEVPAAGGKPAELARSLTLFHAGQAWDYAVEAGEVVRFDPASARFTILDLNRDLTCTVSLAEIDRRLTVGRQETEKYLAELAADPNPSSKALAESLAFQLAPRFEIAGGDGPAAPLTFAGGPVTYTVAAAAPDRPGTAAFYLDYADWTARLNYALRPGGLFPDVRAAVHEELRERAVVPQTVTLTAAPAAPGAPARSLRAEHTFQESLAPRDRGLLAEWRRRLEAGAVREVTFREYVRLTTGAVAGR